MNESDLLVASVDMVISNHGGGCIFNAITDDERFIQVVVPYTLMNFVLCKGDVVAVRGKEVWNKQYGHQVFATDISIQAPTRNTLVSFLSNAKCMRGFGMGKKKILHLNEYFGEELIEVLDKGMWHLLCGEDKFLLSEETAKELIRRWAEHKEQTDAISFVVRHGFCLKVANLILKRYKGSTVKALESDPFRLVAFVEPNKKNWETILAAAVRLGVVDDLDPRRLCGAAELAMYSVHDCGDTAISKKKFKDSLRKYVADVDLALGEALKKGLLIENEVGDIQHKGVASLENWVGSRLAIIARSSGDVFQGAFFDTVMSDNEIEQAISRNHEHEGWRLNDEQAIAVKNSLQGTLSVIIGGAGVGKTSVLKVIGDAVSRHGGQLFQMALAGRAAKRMRDATGYNANTIAGFCNAVKTGKIKVHEGAFLIVDECSMVSLGDMARLLRVVPRLIRLILVGDDYQLPPVSFGDVFGVVANEHCIARSVLTKIYRQDKKTGIPVVANTVRSKRKPILSNYSGLNNGVTFISCEPRMIDSEVVRVYEELSRFGEVQVLSMTNSGIGGVDEINRRLQSRALSNKGGTQDGAVNVSDKVIYLVNDPSLELCNGSLGYVERVNSVENAELLDIVWDDGITRSIPYVTYKTHFKLAYSITVHKAQGSQFERIIIPIRSSRMLDNRMLYTAITRGVKQVVLIGSKDAFDEAVVANSRSSERNVGLLAGGMERLLKTA